MNPAPTPRWPIREIDGSYELASNDRHWLFQIDDLGEDRGWCVTYLPASEANRYLSAGTPRIGSAGQDGWSWLILVDYMPTHQDAIDYAMRWERDAPETDGEPEDTWATLEPALIGEPA